VQTLWSYGGKRKWIPTICEKETCSLLIVAKQSSSYKSGMSSIMQGQRAQVEDPHGSFHWLTILWVWVRLRLQSIMSANARINGMILLSKPQLKKHFANRTPL
jgi:hypothetical protein